MTHPKPAVGAQDAALNRWPTYIAVLLVEALVVIGLWAFGAYFSS